MGVAVSRRAVVEAWRRWVNGEDLGLSPRHRVNDNKRERGERVM